MRRTRVHRLTQRPQVTIAATVACAVGLVAGPIQSAQASYPGGDGRVAFAMVDATGAHIYSILPDGQRLRQLTGGAFSDLCAAYSADGRHMTFCSNRSGSFQIWTMSARGHHLRRLTNLAFATFPDFSPSGDKIAFDGHTAADPNDELYVMNRDGSHLRQITSGAGNNDWPAWSPDGHRLAFVSDRTGVAQVFTMRPDGSHQTQLTFQPVAHGQLPDWRPDGAQIAYSQGDEGAGKIWVMNANGSAQHQVSSGNGDDFGPAWSPDGRRIAFVRDYGTGDRPVMVMGAHGNNVHAVYDPAGNTTQFVPAWQPRGTTRH